MLLSSPVPPSGVSKSGAELKVITPPFVMLNNPSSAPVPASVKVSDSPSPSVAAAVPTAV